MLARALYAHAELDQDIPATLYTAVAQVLAYVYRLKAAMRGEGPMPGEVPQPAVPPELDPLQPNRPCKRHCMNPQLKTLQQWFGRNAAMLPGRSPRRCWSSPSWP